mmetsp:Transcript_15556/g.36426  ORF Transcript_15556/g.36426 Transcript_15556/m.36426 type:complete len:350 (-) Transcript_15556:2229-3278(-)
MEPLQGQRLMRLIPTSCWMISSEVIRNPSIDQAEESHKGTPPPAKALHQRRWNHPALNRGLGVPQCRMYKPASNLQWNRQQVLLQWSLLRVSAREARCRWTFLPSQKAADWASAVDEQMSLWTNLLLSNLTWQRLRACLSFLEHHRRRHSCRRQWLRAPLQQHQARQDTDQKLGHAPILRQTLMTCWTISWQVREVAAAGLEEEPLLAKHMGRQPPMKLRFRRPRLSWSHEKVGLCRLICWRSRRGEGWEEHGQNPWILLAAIRLSGLLRRACLQAEEDRPAREPSVCPQEPTVAWHEGALRHRKPIPSRKTCRKDSLSSEMMQRSCLLVQRLTCRAGLPPQLQHWMQS